MTLNEKFDEADRLTTSRESHNLKCVEIAENFAMDFAKWCASDEAQSLVKDLIIVGEINKVLEVKDLMKIYKKSKGL